MPKSETLYIAVEWCTQKLDAIYTNLLMREAFFLKEDVNQRRKFSVGIMKHILQSVTHQI